MPGIKVQSRDKSSVISAELPKDILRKVMLNADDRKHLETVHILCGEHTRQTGKEPTHLIVDHITYRKIKSNVTYFNNCEYVRPPNDFDRFIGLIVCTTNCDVTYIKVL